ncbi:hypothetical protein PSTT_01392 [Puccinia striiformis]|uniref:Uncharacterized protein n=1 Tax=Puccinia striiformis TaxID=27350 RepID=A0A2S4W3F9_9BASI|nr:hypothetical protein PSTT_01392 [Puccinia striiformis]
MDPSSNSAEEQGLLVPEKFTHHGIGPLANTPKEASQAVHHQSFPQSHTFEGPSSFDEDGNSRYIALTLRQQSVYRTPAALSVINLLGFNQNYVCQFFGMIFTSATDFSIIIMS